MEQGYSLQIFLWDQNEPTCFHRFLLLVYLEEYQSGQVQDVNFLPDILPFLDDMLSDRDRQS